MSLTRNSYPLDVNQCPHQTTQNSFMIHYVKSSDMRRRGQLKHLAQKNAGTKFKHLRKLPLKQGARARVRACVRACVCVCVCVTTHILLC